MSYFLVDDQMHSHDKTLELVGSSVGRQAIGLWAAAGSWCGGHPETMGAISLKRVLALGFTRKHADTLESVRFWDKTPEGWVFHDWVDHRPNDRKLAKRREDTRNRVRKHRENQDGNALQESVTGKDGHALPGRTVPVPSVPYRTEPDGNAPPDQSPAPGSTNAEVAADIYREVSGLTDLPQMSVNWSPKHQQAVMRFVGWAMEQPSTDTAPGRWQTPLRRELELLKPTWVGDKPITQWAANLGTGKATKATGPLPAQTVDDFDAEATLD